MGRLANERAAIALVLFLTGAALVVSTFGLNFADLGGAFSPMFFPRIVLMIWLVLAAVNLVIDVLARRRGEDFLYLRVGLISLAVLAYVQLLIPLGFFICSAVFGVLVLILLGVRGPIALVLVGLGVPLALVGLFNHVLTMPLPNSPFVWWL